MSADTQQASAEGAHITREHTATPTPTPTPLKGNDRYLPVEHLANVKCGELLSGVDARRGGEVTLFYPKLKEGVDPHALARSLAPTFVQSAPLRDTSYCTLRDSGFDESGALFLILDRPEGTPLYGLLREHKSLDLDLALSLIVQLCELLRRAHDAQLFTSNITLHNLMVAPRPNGALHLSLVDLALDRRPLSAQVYPLPSELISPPHPSLTQERDRRHYAVYLCASLLHHLVFGVAPEAPVQPGVERVWPSLPQRGRQLDRRLEACLHTVLLKGLSINPSARFPLISALQRTLIGLRQLTSISSPAFELLASTQTRLGKGHGSLNLAAPRPGVVKAVEARQRIHKILDGEEASLEDILEREGGSLLR